MAEPQQEDGAVGLTPAPVSSSPSIHVTLPPSPPLSASDHKDTESESHTMESQSSLDSEPIKHQNGDTQPPQQPLKPQFMQHVESQPNDPPPHKSLPKSQPSKPSKSITQTLSSPSQWLNQYSTFVQKNASSVSQIESALRSLTYIIPGRFRDAEIASESLHSGIQLLSLYHDTLLTRAVSKLPGMPKIQSPHSRYTKYWTSNNARYRKIALLLQCAQYTELLWEMAAKRRGEKVRWRVVVFIEGLKAICRLLLLRITGGRMVVPPLPDREAIPEDPEEEADEPEFDDDVAPPGLEAKKKEWTMPRTGLTLPALPSAGDISSFLMQKVLTADDIKPPTALLPKISGTAQAAEILHILRPVIYALAMQRAKNKSDWRPWMLGIFVELAARQIRSERTRRGWERESVMEKEEWSRRGWAMGWWVLRGAFYENVTKGWVDGLCAARYMPGLLGGILEDYKFLWEEYHFASDDM